MSESRYSILERIDQLCDRYEEARLAGQRPLIDDYMREVPEADRSELLRELLRLERDYLIGDQRRRWQQGERVKVQDYLDEEPSLRDYPDLVFELVRADLDYRLQVGETARIEEYLERYPALRAKATAATELILAEYALRLRRGESPSSAEYLSRFPDYADLLRQRLAELSAVPGSDDAEFAEGVQVETVATDRSAPTPVGVETASPAKADALPESAQDPGGMASTASGAVVPGYEILGELGRGGMGVVYKARHCHLGKLVALKLLPASSQSSREAAVRFQREIKAVGALDHPNLVEAHDAGVQSGVVYLAMKLIDGIDLERLVEQRGPLSIAEACELVRQAALGLHYLHQRGLVHRDVKPSNLMRTPEGTVKVLDLGLARWCVEAEAEHGLTGMGRAMGTADFLAPEQIENAADADARADLYGLGGTLFYLLIGHAPFAEHKSHFSKLEAQRYKPPPDMQKLRPEVPTELAELVQRLLAKKPEQRLATAAEVATALAPFTGGALLKEPPNVNRAPPRSRIPAKHSANPRGKRKLAIGFRVGAWSCGLTLTAGILAVVLVGVPSYLLKSSLEKNASPSQMASLPPPPVGLRSPVLPGPQIPMPNPPSSTKPAESPDTHSKEQAKNEEKEEYTGRLSSASCEHVKRATVYLHGKLPDGTQATGSGFFGCKEAPSIILTTTHVVGMLSPDSPRPLEVEVTVNRGEANEWNTRARVLGVDRASDLAVLDIGTPPHPVPEPLLVKAAGGLNPLDEVYVFGFPFGERLGKGVMIRPASVSALRRNKTGVLERVQVNGGMDAGNSGGPVVDNGGAVVGVAVSLMPGRQINSVIPGERVQAILSGRIADLIVQQPYFTQDNKVVVPIAMGTIDPRNLLKEVGLDLWTGDKPADTKSGTRPESTRQPPPNEGDSPHVYFKLKYLAPEGKAIIVFPDLPAGKVYWGQARWVNEKGETYWEAAKPLLGLHQPVYRKPAKLELHYAQGAKRAVDLTLENTFRVSDNDESSSFRIRTIAQLAETVASTGGGSTLLNLRYRSLPSRDLILPDGRSIPNGQLEPIKSEIPRYILSKMELDRLGNITYLSIDDRPLRQLRLNNAKQAEQIKDFHGIVQLALESLSVTMPANGIVNPLESWKKEHSLSIDNLPIDNLPIDTPGKTESGRLDATFTYQGTRKRDGREEAVLNMDGLVRSKDNGVGGSATGQVIVDLASGQTTLAETTMKLQLRVLVSRPGEPSQEQRVIATMRFRIVRKLLV